MKTPETKIARNDYPLHDILRHRWSPRAFDNQFIEPARLRSLFEAARWSPSASNIQPWYYIVGMKGDETYANILETLVEFNQLWAPSAPVLVLNIAQIISPAGIPNGTSLYDLGQSVAHLSFQAMHEGIYVHQMSGFEPQKATQLFNIPDEYLAISVMALGYPGKPQQLHIKLQPTEISLRERRPAQKSVFSGTFGLPSTIFSPR